MVGNFIRVDNSVSRTRMLFLVEIIKKTRVVSEASWKLLGLTSNIAMKCTKQLQE